MSANFKKALDGNNIIELQQLVEKNESVSVTSLLTQKRPDYNFGMKIYCLKMKKQNRHSKTSKAKLSEHGSRQLQQDKPYSRLYMMVCLRDKKIFFIIAKNEHEDWMYTRMKDSKTNRYVGGYMFIVESKFVAYTNGYPIFESNCPFILIQPINKKKAIEPAFGLQSSEEKVHFFRFSTKAVHFYSPELIKLSCGEPSCDTQHGFDIQCPGVMP